MKAGRITAIGILAIILTWEILFSLNLIDSSRFSHPLATIQALRDAAFLHGLGILLRDVIVVSFLATLIGLALAVIVTPGNWLINATRRFLRLCVWAPFFILWAIPYWPLGTPTTVVSLFTWHRFLVLREDGSLPWSRMLLEVSRPAILHALLFYLLFEVGTEVGWLGFIKDVDGAYAVFITTVMLVYLVNRLFRSYFFNQAELERTVLLKGIAHAGNGSLWGAALLTICYLAVWQIFPSLASRYFNVGSPMDVVKASYLILAGERLFADVGISLLEVLAGLFLSGTIAVLVTRIISGKGSPRNFLLAFLPITFIAPITIRLIEFYWSGMIFGDVRFYLVDWQIYPWATTLDVALLSFYPFILTLWGLRNYVFQFRLLLAADAALPYAFLAMLFGEMMSATKGVGLYIILGRNVSPTDRFWANGALGLSLLVFTLLVILSILLRSFAKRCALIGTQSTAT